MKLKPQGIHTHVETLLQSWAQMRLCETQLKIGEQFQTAKDFGMGEIGVSIKKQIEWVRWWRLIQKQPIKRTSIIHISQL